MLFTLLVQVAVCFAGLASLFHDHCVLALQRYILKVVVEVYVSDVNIMWWGLCTFHESTLWWWLWMCGYIHFGVHSDAGCVGVLPKCTLCFWGWLCDCEYFAGHTFFPIVVVLVLCKGTLCWLLCGHFAEVHVDWACWCMCLQRHPGEKMLGVLPRISIEFKSTYTATATKEYDMVSQSFFSRVVLCCWAVLSACE